MMSRMLPEWSRVSDRYFWMTAFIIAKNSITREYQSSFLGVVWTVINPLIQVVVYAIIMPLILARTSENYAVHLVASFPLWAFFQSCLVMSCHSIISQAETIKRCVVSSVVFPIADVLKHFHTYLVSFLTMYIFCLLFVTKFDPVVLWLPLVLLPIVITITAVSIAIAFAAPYVRDVGYLVHMIMVVLLWATPVIYPISAVPEQYQWVFWLNPFFIMIHPVQQLMVAHMLPNTVEWLGMLGVMLVAITVSLVLYRLCRRNYVYYL